VLFILQAGYFKAKTLFFSFEIDEVADDVKHVLQQHYPQYHDAALKSYLFGEIKRRAFSILERDKIKRAADFDEDLIPRPQVGNRGNRESKWDSARAHFDLKYSIH
jgi:hypothetical protein